MRCTTEYREIVWDNWDSLITEMRAPYRTRALYCELKKEEDGVSPAQHPEPPSGRQVDDIRHPDESDSDHRYQAKTLHPSLLDIVIRVSRRRLTISPREDELAVVVGIGHTSSYARQSA